MTENKLISIIIPAYNESGVIEPFHKALISVIESNSINAEVIYVNDGSKDSTMKELTGLFHNDQRVKVIEFSRNFGKESAILSGVDISNGDALIVMDSDMQHPPSLIPTLVNMWESGIEIVQCIRKEDGYNKNRLYVSKMFNKLYNFLSNTSMENGLTDFGIIDRKVIDCIKSYREKRRLYRALVSTVGFNRATIEFVAPDRSSGTSKFSPIKLITLAIDAMTSMSYVPLYIAFYTGLAMFVLSVLEGVYAVLVKIATFHPLPGWTSIVGWISLFSGVQSMLLGIIGIYIARIFEESKNRPDYTIREILHREDTRDVN